jgi:protein TonB
MTVTARLPDAGSADDDDLHLKRWAVAALVGLGAHAALIAAYLYVAPTAGISGSEVPPLLVDFEPEAAAPETQADLAPGPDSVETPQTLQPEAPQQAAEEPEIEVPRVETPDPDILIPEKKEVVEDRKPEVPQPKPPEPVKEPVRQQTQPVKQPTASPKVEKRAPKPVTPKFGTTAARNAMADYASTISAHLQRFKRPANGTGTAVVSFTVNRGGRVLSSRISRSSGSPAVDAEAMAMVARAQPMPPFPASLPQAQENFVLPIRFR